jgi:hypothetical protein
MKPEGERSDWTDTDLLTVGEASVRLQNVAKELRAQIWRQPHGDFGRVTIPLRAERTSIEKCRSTGLTI